MNLSDSYVPHNSGDVPWLEDRVLQCMRLESEETRSGEGMRDADVLNAFKFRMPKKQSMISHSKDWSSSNVSHLTD